MRLRACFRKPSVAEDADRALASHAAARGMTLDQCRESMRRREEDFNQQWKALVDEEVMLHRFTKLHENALFERLEKLKKDLENENKH